MLQEPSALTHPVHALGQSAAEPKAECSTSNPTGVRHASSYVGRQISIRPRPHLSDRHPGPRPPRASPAPARRAAGLNTAGFISGYRGSPLGGLDEALWKAGPHLQAHAVKFQPGINEELAATAVWGTQQVHLLGDSNYDGVFAMWYGKGPGVDRCGDVFKHMNFAGTSGMVAFCW